MCVCVHAYLNLLKINFTLWFHSMDAVTSQGAGCHSTAGGDEGQASRGAGSTQKPIGEKCFQDSITGEEAL